MLCPRRRAILLRALLATISIGAGSHACAVDGVSPADQSILGKFESGGVEMRKVQVLDRRSGDVIDLVLAVVEKADWPAAREMLGSLRDVDKPLSLEFRGINFAEKDFAPLAGATSIIGVQLSGCQAPLGIYEQIAGLPKLRFFSASGQSAQDASLAAFAGHPQLRMLTLEGRGITDAAVPHLRQIRDLDYLGIRVHGLTADGAAALHRALPQSEVSVFDPRFDVPVWKLDRSKAFVYVLPSEWSAQNRGLPHDVIMLHSKDRVQRNIVISDQPGDSTLAELKQKYEGDLPRAFKDFELVSSELLPSDKAPKMVRIVHTNTNPGVPVRQVNYIIEVGKRRYFVACTVMKDDGDKYDAEFEAFVKNILPPEELK